jgi:lipoprotein-releasing system ATP-binding protein
VVFDMMLQLARQRRTAFILATHDDQLARRCGRVLRLQGGKLNPLSDSPARVGVAQRES